MPRVKRGVQARARHKKLLNEAKGYYGARSRVYRVLNRQSSKPRNMLIGIAGKINGIFVHCGLSVLMRARDCMGFPIAD